MGLRGSIRYGAVVGFRLGVADRTVEVAPVRRSSGALLLLALFVLQAFACTVERRPEIGDDRRLQLNNIRQIGGDITPDDQFGEDVTGPAFGMDDEEGGKECGGAVCPFVSEPIEQCCTSDGDVEGGRARFADRCGLSFDAVGGSSFGSGCWQRDQVGVSDTRCEDLKGPSGELLELGCCTDQGMCGTHAAASGVGCHYRDGVAPAQCAEEMPTPGVECNPLGIFGVRINVDVAWGGRSGGLVGLTDDGRDDLLVDLRIEVQSIDDQLRFIGVAKPCQVVLPPFYSTTLCESYKPLFPDRIWESPMLPAIGIAGQYSCMTPGCIMSIEPTTTLLGISLANPEAPWPNAGETGAIPCADGSGEDCFPDQDDDGWPGLTIELEPQGKVPWEISPQDPACMSTGYEYWGAPLAASLGAVAKIVRRSDRVHLGTRTKLGGASRMSNDCMSGIGTGIAEFVQSRAWSCMVQEGTTDGFQNPAGPNDECTGGEAGFMDENLPIYAVLAEGEVPPDVLKNVDTSPSAGPRISMVRLGDLGSQVACADVRAATYPE